MKLRAFLAGAALAAVTALAAASANADILYDNHGPATHTANAWTIDYGFEVSDSFNLAQASTLTGVNFDGWNLRGETATSVDWMILNGSPEFGGSTLSSGTGALTVVSTGATGFGVYPIDTYSFALPSVNLAAGAYWLTLKNAQGASVTYWDESDGASQSYQTNSGEVPSHTFAVTGKAGAIPEPATWALMLTGFLGAGAALRGQHRRVYAAA
jgi:hypothetical protein